MATIARLQENDRNPDVPSIPLTETAGETGHPVSVSPASVHCPISNLLLHDRLLLTRHYALGSSVARVEEEDHAHGDQVLRFHAMAEVSHLEKRCARHISPIFEAGQQVGRESSLIG